MFTDSTLSSHTVPERFTMEVVALSGGSNSAPPFKREVHEWQHIDAKTGALLSGRLEADRYVNGNTNSFGKVSEITNAMMTRL